LPTQDVGFLVRQLYALTSELGSLYPKRSFTPDGRMSEAFCEVLAAQCFELELLPASSKVHNARTRDKSVLVQIKSAQGETIVWRSDQIPQHLLVLKLSETGVPELIYNGPGLLAYTTTGKQPSSGQRAVRLATLRKIQVPPQEQLSYSGL
jgi:hypothetical protein